MATIAIFGGTGYAGGAIRDEALRRGHTVITVSRREVAARARCTSPKAVRESWTCPPAHRRRRQFDHLGRGLRQGLRGRDRAASPPEAALQRGLLGVFGLIGSRPGHREAEGGQGTRIVQDRRAQVVDPHGGEAVVTGQAVVAVCAP